MSSKIIEGIVVTTEYDFVDKIKWKKKNNFSIKKFY